MVKDELNKVEKLGIRPFTRFCMSIGAVPSSYIAGLTIEEQLLWLCSYLEKEVIPTVNNNGEAVEELQDLFVELKNYVDNYFDNLDVQEEINNKLDDMADSGVLADIITEYIQLKGQLVYNNVNEMKNATNIVDGTFLKTYGFYNYNDGGGALYKARTITNDDIVDEMTIIALNDDTLIAELIIQNDTINFKQLGAKPCLKDGTKYDNASYLEAYLNLIANSDKKYKLFIPSGIWCFSEVIFPSKINGFDIEGIANFNLDYASKGTVITSYYDNQNTIWSTSASNVNGSTNFNFENLLFSSADYTFDDENSVWEISQIKAINNCLTIINSGFGILNNICFEQIKGSALRISSSWEIYYKLLFFRFINALSKDGIVIIDNVSEYHTSDSAGVNASSFDNIMFEAVHGNLIKIKSNSIFGNSNFKNINFEDFRYTLDGTYSNATSSTNTHSSQYTRHSLFDIEDNAYLLPIYINNIELNNVAKNIYSVNSNNYIYDTLINLGSNTRGNITINNINCHGMYKNLNIISNYPEKQMATSFRFTINNVNCTGKNTEDIGAIFDVYGFKKLNPGNVNLNFDRNDAAATVTDNQFNTVIPFYQLSYINANSNKGFLFFDPDSNNKLKLTVSPKNADVSGDSLYAVFVKSGNTLKLRAKIPNGETYKFIVNDRAHNGVLTVTGTGSYEIYTIDITNLEFGKTCRFLKASDSTTDNMYMDWMIMY